MQIQAYFTLLRWSGHRSILHLLCAWVLNSGLQIFAVEDRDLWVPCIDIDFLIIWIRWLSLLFTVNSIGNLQFTGYYNQICSQYELCFTKQPISLSGDRFTYVSDIFFCEQHKFIEF